MICLTQNFSNLAITLPVSSTTYNIQFEKSHSEFSQYLFYFKIFSSLLVFNSGLLSCHLEHQKGL